MKLPLLVLALVLAVIAKDVAAQESAFLRLHVSGSTYVPGDNPGNKDESTLHGYRHDIILPFDPATGQITGSVVYQPMYVVKKVNVGSVPARTLHAQGSHLQDARVRFVQYDPGDGLPTDYFTVTLEDVIIGRIETFALDRTHDVAHRGVHYERLELQFRRITWRWEATGFEFTYDFLTATPSNVGSVPEGVPAIEVSGSDVEVFGFEVFQGISGAELFRIAVPRSN